MERALLSCINCGYTMPAFLCKATATVILIVQLFASGGCTTEVPISSTTGEGSTIHYSGWNERTASQDADEKILFIGNSHTSSNHLPLIVARLMESDNTGKKVHVQMCASGAFLSDHAQDADTRRAVADGDWDWVVLQAQKYSTSGRFSYPYDGAVTLSKLATQSGARVVMFPEWRRVGHPDEGKRIHRLHEKIAKITAARVAPVGLAWDQALDERPGLELHRVDGNHAAPHGTYLTACVFYSVFNERSPQGLPDAGIEISSKTRAFLQRIAWETVQQQVNRRQKLFARRN